MKNNQNFRTLKKKLKNKLSKDKLMYDFGPMNIVRTRFESLAQKMDGLRPKKPKIMNL